MRVRGRFWLYRNLVASFTWVAFRSQKVRPLEAPVDGSVQFRPYAQAHPGLPVPGLYAPVTFPAGDRAARRLRRIETTKRLLAQATRIAPPDTPPIPRDPTKFLAVAYPRLFRKAWPTAPRVPPELAAPGADVIGELAVRAPFGSYLRRADDGGRTYVLDLDWMAAYEARPALVRPGGRAVLTVSGGRLVTTAVHCHGLPPERARAVLLAALNEDLTTFRHNLSVHLAMLTSFTLATTNKLGAKHPVRRLLHHCFHTVLIGNHEVAELQLSGPRGLSATIFSHDAGQLAAMAGDYLRRFDLWDFEPGTQFRRRGTMETPFAYPYRDNVMRLWSATRAYVEDYLRLYYQGDEAVRGDPQLTDWGAE